MTKLCTTLHNITYYISFHNLALHNITLHTRIHTHKHTHKHIYLYIHILEPKHQPSESQLIAPFWLVGGAVASCKWTCARTSGGEPQWIPKKTYSSHLNHVDFIVLP